jgi:hypothetical protein
MCQATGVLTAIAEKRRRVWRFPLIYCVATWEFFLFQPLISMLMFGAIFCLALFSVWRYFRQAAPRAAGVVEGSRAAVDQKIEDQTEHRLDKIAAPFCKSARKSWTMKCAGSSQNFTMP